jgi:lysozyme family protein
MTTANYEACLAKTLSYEGGYSSNPDDPGNWTGCAQGAGTLKGTNKGISACAYPDEDIANLTDEEIEAIYFEDYWAVVGGDELPAGLDLCTFDGGVNSGPANGVTWLQRAVGVPDAHVDGAFGPETRQYAQAAEPHAAIDAACDCRLAFLKSLDTWPTFGAGWQNRVDDVRKSAHDMARAGPPAPKPEPAPTVATTITIRIDAPPGVTINVQGPAS